MATMAVLFVLSKRHESEDAAFPHHFVGQPLMIGIGRDQPAERKSRRQRQSRCEQTKLEDIADET
jgi:hypothetical protein